MSYRELYFKLFAAITDALAALQSGRVIQAMRILLRATEESEAAHMELDLLPERPVNGKRNFPLAFPASMCYK